MDFEARKLNLSTVVFMQAQAVCRELETRIGQAVLLHGVGVGSPAAGPCHMWGLAEDRSVVDAAGLATNSFL